MISTRPSGSAVDTRVVGWGKKVTHGPSFLFIIVFSTLLLDVSSKKPVLQLGEKTHLAMKPIPDILFAMTLLPGGRHARTAHSGRDPLA
jgi:hypothetical protein